MMDRAYREIVDNIARIYERYAVEASKKTEEKRTKAGLPPDKDEKRFFDIVTDLVTPLRSLYITQGRSASVWANLRPSQRTIK